MLWWSTPITFVNARVVGVDGRLSRTLRVSRGRIDGIGVAPDKSDTVLDLDGALIFPGLINAHDHLELNSQPRLKWRERYENAREWIADFQPRFDSDPQLAVTRPETLADRVWVGGRPFVSSPQMFQGAQDFAVMATGSIDCTFALRGDGFLPALMAHIAADKAKARLSKRGA